MDRTERTKEALSARVESLCNAIYDERSVDPRGGNGYLSTILRTVKPRDSSDFSTVPKLEEARDYATSAQKELAIKNAKDGLIKTAHDISTLIRDLQELWLFGGLDTLSDPADEEANRTKAVEVARMIEVLAKSGPVADAEDQNGVNGEEARHEVSEEVKKQSEG